MSETKLHTYVDDGNGKFSLEIVRDYITYTMIYESVKKSFIIETEYDGDKNMVDPDCEEVILEATQGQNFEVKKIYFGNAFGKMDLKHFVKHDNSSKEFLKLREKFNKKYNRNRIEKTRYNERDNFDHSKWCKISNKNFNIKKNDYLKSLLKIEICGSKIEISNCPSKYVILKIKSDIIPYAADNFISIVNGGIDIESIFVNEFYYHTMIILDNFLKTKKSNLTTIIASKKFYCCRITYSKNTGKKFFQLVTKDNFSNIIPIIPYYDDEYEELIYDLNLTEIERLRINYNERFPRYQHTYEIYDEDNHDVVDFYQLAMKYEFN